MGRRTYREIAEDIINWKIMLGRLKVKTEEARQRAIELQIENQIKRWGPDD